MSIRRLLLLYVLAHDADGRSSAGGSEVAGRPEHAFPVALADVGALLAQQATGNTLEAVHERGDGHFGRIFHERVCTWSSSPSICTRVACAAEQTSTKMLRSTSIASASNTQRRYFATKIQCACNLKMQCLPCRMLLSLLMDQP